MGVTDARTIRALYCNELEMSAGHEQRTAMHRPHNRQMRQGETGTRAQRLRSGATRVHGGEHGSHLLLGGAALGGLVKPNELHGQPIARLSSLARRKLADEALCDAYTLRDLRLCHPGLRQVGDEVLPVHAPIIAFAII